MSTSEKPGRTAEGRLLHAAMLRRRWKAPRLANEASLSTETVRNIVKGYRILGRGKSIPVVPPPETLAYLADALGNITDDDLMQIGRADAVAALRIIRSERSGGRAHERLEMLRVELGELEAKLGKGGGEGAASHPRVQMPPVSDGQ